MPKIEFSVGFVLSVKRYNENNFILDVFTPDAGRYAGLYRGKNAPQPATFVQGRWQARLSEQLGHLYIEPLNAFGVGFLDDKKRLSALLCACYLIEKTIPERQPYPDLYAAFNLFLEALDSNHFLQHYALFEYALLNALGFGLDLTKCAADDTTTDLIYVSPKTGRAVCAKCGAPYRDKLLPLPAFFQKPMLADSNTIAQALQLTGTFLKKHTDIELPLARQNLFF